jgi:hypothetical protein
MYEWWNRLVIGVDASNRVAMLVLKHGEGAPFMNRKAVAPPGCERPRGDDTNPGGKSKK